MIQPESPKLTRIFIKEQPPDLSGVRASWLARLLLLDVNANTLLTRRAAADLNVGAVILAIVVLFELATWTLLFNFIFNSSLFYRGPGLASALLAGSLFATVIFYFERGIFMHDDVSGRRIGQALLARLVFIIVSSLITSQPLELLVFQKPIEARVHEEEVRKEAVRRLKSMQRLEDELARQVSALAVAGVGAEPSQHGASNRTWAAELEIAKGRLRTLNAELRQKRERLTWVERQLTQGGYRRYLLGVRQAATPGQPSVKPDSAAPPELPPWLLDFAQEEGLLRGEVAGLEGEVQSLNSALASTEKRISSQQAGIDAFAGRLVEWLAEISEARPREEIREGSPPSGEASWEMRFREYDFFEQFRVLMDLLFGRSPRWPGGNPDDVRRIAMEFGLRDPQPCREEPAASANGEAASRGALGCDGSEWERQQARSHIFQWTYGAIFLAGLFIPLLVLVTKLLFFSEDLRIYFSRAHQAVAGNPEAREVAAIDDQVNSEHSDH